MSPPSLCHPPRLFVSYSHDSPEHVDRVLALSDRLRSLGIDAWVDQYEVSPPEGWPRWCAAQVRKADFVLVICTEIYERRFQGEDEPGRGLGAAWEGVIISQEIYDAAGVNTRFIPAFFPPAGPQHVPVILRGATRYDLGSEQDFWRLYRSLTFQPEISAPPLGHPVPLPRQERRLSLASIPRYEDERSRRLAEEMEAVYRQLEELTIARQDTQDVRERILRIRRELREGGRLLPGDLLGDGRFKLLELIGSGGFATVWRAYDRQRTGLVAVKVLHGLHAGDRTRRERFFRGARKMAELQHPGIVRVVETHLEDGGHHFFVLEHVNGGDLRAAVLGGRLQRGEVLPLILKVGEALVFAHGKGIIHRDVKPANILMDGGQPKLTDFDLVHAVDTTGGTQSQGMLGTFLYAAPEMLNGPGRAGPTVDVYSLAMTMIFALHGEELPAAVFRSPEPLVQSLSCPEAARRLLLRAVSWESSERPSSMTLFCGELQQAFQPPETAPAPAPQKIPAIATTSKLPGTQSLDLPLRPSAAQAGQDGQPLHSSTRQGTAPSRRAQAPATSRQTLSSKDNVSSTSLRILFEQGLGALLLLSVGLALLLNLARPGALPSQLSTNTVEAALGAMLTVGIILLFRRLIVLGLTRARASVRRQWDEFVFASARRKARREKEEARRKVITKHLQRVAEEKQKREANVKEGLTPR